MKVRRFIPDDSEAVVALWQDCELTRPWNDPWRDIERKLSIQPELFLVATEDGQIIGTVMAGYDGHRGWINYLAVAPGHRGAGVGRSLMTAAEHGLHALGCPKVNLQVRVSNEQALGFYAALGYATDDVVSLGKRLVTDDR